jgi:biotin transport system substrate-specific component
MRAIEVPEVPFAPWSKGYRARPDMEWLRELRFADRLRKDPPVLTVAPNVLGARLGASRRVMTATLIIGFALFTALSAQMKIYLPNNPVPISGQTFAVLLTGAALGMRAGGASQGVYLLMGAIGLPVFTDGTSGLEVLFGPTSGYLFGFVIAAAIVGRLAEATADRRVRTAIPAFVAGSAVIYAFGVIGLMVTLDIGLGEAFALGVVPFIIGDALKAVGAGLLLPAAWRVSGR